MATRDQVTGFQENEHQSLGEHTMLRGRNVSRSELKSFESFEACDPLSY